MYEVGKASTGTGRERERATRVEQKIRELPNQSGSGFVVQILTFQNSAKPLDFETESEIACSQLKEQP